MVKVRVNFAVPECAVFIPFRLTASEYGNNVRYESNIRELPKTGEVVTYQT